MRTRSVATVAGPLALTLVLGACGGGSDDAGTTAGDEPAAEAAPDQAQRAFGGEEEAARGDLDDTRDGSASTTDRPGFSAASQDISIQSLRKVIRDADISIVVEDTDRAFTQIRQLANRSGGYIASADLQQLHEREGDEPQLFGTVVLRVPSSGLDDVLGELERLAVKVTSKSLSSDDVTDEYVDLEARLTNLRALESELQELLAEVRQAGDPDPDDLFVVFERIRQVRDEIERIQGRLRMLDELVDLSTVTVRLAPSSDPQVLTTARGPWEPGQIVAEAASALVAAVQGVANVAIWLGIFVLPVLAMLAFPAVAALLGYRWWRRKGEATAA
ncbi:MAG: DUF4349 domain-containing protein [Nitriliruptorales bacterium]